MTKFAEVPRRLGMSPIRGPSPGEPAPSSRRAFPPDDTDPAAADDKLLECAVAGAADYLVSADADLLILGSVQGIPILGVPAFWQKLAE